MVYNKIKTECNKQKISIPVLAEKINMTKSGLYKAIENKTLTIEKIQEIANVLGVPVIYFFEEGQIINQTLKRDHEAIINFLIQETKNSGKIILNLGFYLECQISFAFFTGNDIIDFFKKHFLKSIDLLLKVEKNKKYWELKFEKKYKQFTIEDKMSIFLFEDMDITNAYLSFNNEQKKEFQSLIKSKINFVINRILADENLILLKKHNLITESYISFLLFEKLQYELRKIEIEGFETDFSTYWKLSDKEKHDITNNEDPMSLSK